MLDVGGGETGCCVGHGVVDARDVFDQGGEARVDFGQPQQNHEPGRPSVLRACFPHPADGVGVVGKGQDGLVVELLPLLRGLLDHDAQVEEERGEFEMGDCDALVCGQTALHGEADLPGDGGGPSVLPPNAERPDVAARGVLAGVADGADVGGSSHVVENG